MSKKIKSKIRRFKLGTPDGYHGYFFTWGIDAGGGLAITRLVQDEWTITHITSGYAFKGATIQARTWDGLQRDRFTMRAEIHRELEKARIKMRLSGGLLDGPACEIYNTMPLIHKRLGKGSSAWVDWENTRGHYAKMHQCDQPMVQR